MRYRQQIWTEYLDLVRANPLVQQPGLFHDWLGGLYATTQMVTIRRQAEAGDPRIITLGKLLRDMEANARALTRRRFVLGHPTEWRDEAHGWFGGLAGTGANHLDPAVPR